MLLDLDLGQMSVVRGVIPLSQQSVDTGPLTWHLELWKNSRRPEPRYVLSRENRSPHQAWPLNIEKTWYQFMEYDINFVYNRAASRIALRMEAACIPIRIRLYNGRSVILVQFGLIGGTCMWRLPDINFRYVMIIFNRYFFSRNFSLKIIICELFVICNALWRMNSTSSVWETEAPLESALGSSIKS